jgi:hypothetical protein
MTTTGVAMTFDKTSKPVSRGGCDELVEPGERALELRPHHRRVEVAATMRE